VLLSPKTRRAIVVLLPLAGYCWRALLRYKLIKNMANPQFPVLRFSFGLGISRDFQSCFKFQLHPVSFSWFAKVYLASTNFLQFQVAPQYPWFWLLKLFTPFLTAATLPHIIGFFL
jgi:hypothetical protein